MSEQPVLSVDGLEVHYPVRVGGILRGVYQPLRAVDDVSLELARGEALGIVGESGCGKSTMGRAALMLTAPKAGHVLWDGDDVTAADEKTLRAKRRDFQLVFQDPLSSLNPRMTIFEIIAEPLRSFHPELSDDEVKSRVEDTIERVGLLPKMMLRYPHEFSGGQCQRISIARAVILKPKVLILDEPVSALDVSVQAQIINLLKDLQAELGLSYLFISHDLAVVRYMCDRVLVMYLGKVMETASREQLFSGAVHPYTRALLSAIPDVDRPVSKGLDDKVMQSELPSPLNPPSGCCFHTRCSFVSERCKSETPALQDVSNGHVTACHHWRDVLAAKAE